MFDTFPLRVLLQQRLRFMRSINCWHVSDLSVWYTFDFLQPHKKVQRGHMWRLSDLAADWIHSSDEN